MLRVSGGVPMQPLLLGVAGLLPFVALAIAYRFARPLGLDRLAAHDAEAALTAYSAAILAFMGGAQWGLAMSRASDRASEAWRAYGASVVPALVAAGIHVALSTGWIYQRHSHIAFVAAFLALLAYDAWTVSRGEAPPWYLPLRAGLTAIVVASLMLAWSR